MSNLGELADLDALDQAAAVRSGEIAPDKLVGMAIERLEAANPSLNCVVSTCYERALDEASSVDRSLPFAGVPLLVKDNQDAVGLPTRAASRYLADNPPAGADHPLVARLRAAGFIPIGHSNMPELGLLAATEPELYGPCRNPWDQDRTCGGSSGGSACAVAARVVPVGTASDGGGSIRIPAAACGLVGLKPSRARTPGAAWGGLAVNGVVTRSVRDSAAVLDVIAGLGPGNVAALPVPPGGFAAAAERELEPLRVALCRGVAANYHPEVCSAVQDTAALLADLGHRVEEVEFDLFRDRFGTVSDDIYRTVFAAIARQFEIWEQRFGRPPTADQLEPLTWLYLVEGRKFTAVELLRAFDAAALLSEEVRPLFERFDVLVLPTLTEPAPRLGSWRFPADDPMSGWVRMSQFVPPFTCQLANYLGVPAITVPLHESSTGLPIGSQLYGHYGEEASLLALAAALERARPWSARAPQLVSR